MTASPVLVIVGPTASGKTELAVECAKELNGEIISADSMQIYKGMQIATAKPTEDEMQGIKHYLTDFLDPSESFSVAEFKRLADSAADEIVSKGKLPIVCGGTGLYIDSFVYNIQFTSEEDSHELRQSLEEKFDSVGAEEMLRQLSEFDPNTADSLSVSDRKRIIRAFEVYLLTGKTITQAKLDSRLQPPKYRSVLVGVNYSERERLYERINRRVELMLEQGLVDEAKRFFDLPDKYTASQAIGYKELAPYLNGLISLDEAVENLKKSTRHYAKRQLTWFKRNKNIKWFYPDLYNDRKEFIMSVTDYVKEAIK